MYLCVKLEFSSIILRRFRRGKVISGPTSKQNSKKPTESRVKTSALLFANNSNLSWFFLIFLIIDSNFLISKVIKQIFNPNTDYVTPIGIPSQEKTAETEKYSRTADAKWKRHSI